MNVRRKQAEGGGHAGVQGRAGWRAVGVILCGWGSMAGRGCRHGCRLLGPRSGCPNSAPTPLPPRHGTPWGVACEDGRRVAPSFASAFL
jgi:hypothetical protein